MDEMEAKIMGDNGSSHTRQQIFNVGEMAFYGKMSPGTCTAGEESPCLVSTLCRTGWLSSLWLK